MPPHNTTPLLNYKDRIQSDYQSYLNNPRNPHAKYTWAKTLNREWSAMIRHYGETQAAALIAVWKREADEKGPIYAQEKDALYQTASAV